MSSAERKEKHVFHLLQMLAEIFFLIFFTGEVFDYLVAHGRMKEKEARAKFRQVLNAKLNNYTIFLDRTILSLV